MNKLTEAEFQKDMQKAREGLSNKELSALIDKWGVRGGAFFNFLQMKGK